MSNNSTFNNNHINIMSEQLICPITQMIFSDPVICSDGHTYERCAINKWLNSDTERRSPLTKEEECSIIGTNYIILNLIESMIKTIPELKKNQYEIFEVGTEISKLPYEHVKILIEKLKDNINDSGSIKKEKYKLHPTNALYGSQNKFNSCFTSEPVFPPGSYTIYPLHLIFRYADQKIVGEIIETEFDINKRDGQSTPLIFYAIAFCSLKNLKLFLKKKPNLKITDRYKRNILSFVLMYGTMEKIEIIIKELLRNYPVENIREFIMKPDVIGLNPLFYSIAFHHVNILNMIKRQLKLNYNPNTFYKIKEHNYYGNENHYTMNLLIWGIYRNNISVVKQFLSSNGDITIETGLYQHSKIINYALAIGNLEMINLFLERKPYIKPDFEDTFVIPLHKTLGNEKNKPFEIADDDIEIYGDRDYDTSDYDSDNENNDDSDENHNSNFNDDSDENYDSGSDIIDSYSSDSDGQPENKTPSKYRLYKLINRQNIWTDIINNINLSHLEKQKLIIRLEDEFTLVPNIITMVTLMSFDGLRQKYFKYCMKQNHRLFMKTLKLKKFKKEASCVKKELIKSYIENL